MAIYSYKALNKTGKEIKGSISADSDNIAKAKIKASGLMLISLTEQKAKVQKSSFTFGSSVSVEELSLMTRQFATLISAKIQIIEALNALSNQVDSQQLKLVLVEVKQDVNEGSSLAKALKKHPKIFNNIYVNMVEAGEASGNLHVVLQRLAEFSEDEVRLRNKVKGAMTYPILMGVVGILGMGFIFTVIIPKIVKIFISSKIELPLATKITVAISNFLLSYWWAVILFVILFFFLLWRYIKTPSGESNWHSLQLKLPLVGKVITMVNVERFCSTLGTLLSSGVPIIASLNIVRNLITNVHIKEAIEKSKLSVQEGSSMSGPLAESGYFPSMVTHMIHLGENTGELESMLGIIAENYHDQVESRLNGLTSILEPVMMIVLGIGVGVIVLSVVVPMMKLGQMGR